MRYKMEPMDRDEVADYLKHHMQLAGAKTEVFSPPAIEAIASHSAGRPRPINNLAVTSLLLGAQMKRNPVDEDVVRLASAEASL